MDHNDIINFWFDEIDSAKWWAKDPDFDALIKERFLGIHNKAINDELNHWRKTADGSLAEVIVLDQFSRNIFRDAPQSFAYDDLALACSAAAIKNGQAHDLIPRKRGFLYMPYMHSESVAAHEEAVTLFSQEGMQGTLNFEYKHKKIIDRFGRYPHRNQILGRESTPEEIDFLNEPNSSF